MQLEGPGSLGRSSSGVPRKASAFTAARFHAACPVKADLEVSHFTAVTPTPRKLTMVKIMHLAKTLSWSFD